MDDIRALMVKELCLPVAKSDTSCNESNLNVEESELQALKKIVEENISQIEALLDTIEKTSQTQYKKCEQERSQKRQEN